MPNIGGNNLTTQKDRVLAHLQMHGEITTMTAFSFYGITRLSEYIRALRSEGYRIETTYQMKNGKPNNYATYIWRNDD